MNKPTKIIVILALAAALFYGGFAYGASSSSGSAPAGASAFGSARSGTKPTANGTGEFSGGSATVGTVVSSDATSITVALKSGGSVVAFYSTSTPITKITAGSPSDMAAGADITVFGTTNSDGSITASSVQLKQTTSR